VAISRAQIPEQVDIFQEGGSVSSSLTPEDIIALYGAVQSPPVTLEEIQTQAAQMSGLFPEPRKQNIYDLASDVGAGLVGAASDPRGLGAGLTAGFQAFNERSKLIDAEKNKIKQQMAMFAYQQVEAKRKEQAATSNEILKMKFKAALEGTGGMFSDGTTQGAALNYILSAEANPKLKDTPEYKIAVAIVEQKKTTFKTTETGTIPVEVPGLNIAEILGPQDEAPPPTIDIGGTTWTFTGNRDANDDPIYTDGKTEQVIKQTK
jgi:hypothetical protein